jgi:predicted neuraminidase
MKKIFVFPPTNPAIAGLICSNNLTPLQACPNRSVRGGRGAFRSKKIIVFIVILLVFNDLIIKAQFKGDQCIVKSEFIYQPEDVQFPSCHASTIIQNGKGLMAAWFGGTREKDPDVCIWISKYSKGKWTKPVEAADGIQYKGKRYPCWNPVLYNTGKEILLFYKVGPSPSEWWGEMKSSDDSGKTWSRSYRLPEGIIGPVKNKPVMLDNGYLLCPSSTEDEGWRIHMEFTPDNGLTWERTIDLNERKTEVIQPTILIHQSGKIQLLCRSTELKILTSWSEDKGRTWSELIPTILPNPNAGIDAVTLRDGRFLLVYNHLKKGRNSLNIAISEDGTEWKAAVLLEKDQEGTEFSYPAVIQTDDGMVHITYTWKRKLIKHVVIDPAKIMFKSLSDEVWPE